MQIAVVASVTHERTSAGASVEGAATALMQRIEACRSETGMHFAGVPMTVTKAITVGAMLAYAVWAVAAGGPRATNV